MGTTLDIVIVGGPRGAIDSATRRVQQLEARWSRFQRGSDITRLNLAAGRPIRVAADTLRLVEAMRMGWIATGGTFDPTMLLPLVQLGDISSRHDASAVTVLLPDTSSRTAMQEVDIDTEQSTVRLPTGCALDPGGIGKGLAADIVVEEVLTSGADGVLVAVGGDLRVEGAAPQEPGWVIDINDPTGRRTARLHLKRGGVATSGTTVRAWNLGDSPVHHLLSPFTCRSTRQTPADVAEATVVAGTAAWAEVWAKYAIIEPGSVALSALDRHGLAARTTSVRGDRRHSGRWAEFVVADLPLGLPARGR